MLNLLESYGELKNNEERYKAAELLLYFNGHEKSVSYARILTNAKKVTVNPYHQFFITEAWSIYDIYKELLGEFVWKPAISSPDPLKIDTIGRDIFKNHINK